MRWGYERRSRLLRTRWVWGLAFGPWGLLAVVSSGFASWGPSVARAQGDPPAATDRPYKKQPGVRGTEAQIRDGWLSSDAVVFGTYLGVDSTLGPLYHTADITEVWMGSPAEGRLVFKAPRGIRAELDGPLLLMLWDRLSGVSDSYLEESKLRYGDEAWVRIGPDSLAAYLLPFASYSYPFDDGKLILRGPGPFPTKLARRKLRNELYDYEQTLLPETLYRNADTVLFARVLEVERRTLEQFDVVLEHRMFVDLRTIETLKGQAPNPLQLQFGSFPRSPRFSKDEEVIVILTRTEDGKLFLEHGKRSVYHVEKGEVLEVGQPLSEFLKKLRGA